MRPGPTARSPGRRSSGLGTLHAPLTATVKQSWARKGPSARPPGATERSLRGCHPTRLSQALRMWGAALPRRGVLEGGAGPMASQHGAAAPRATVAGHGRPGLTDQTGGLDPARRQGCVSFQSWCVFHLRSHLKFRRLYVKSRPPDSRESWRLGDASPPSRRATSRWHWAKSLGPRPHQRHSHLARSSHTLTLPAPGDAGFVTPASFAVPGSRQWECPQKGVHPFREYTVPGQWSPRFTQTPPGPGNALSDA